MVCAPWDRLDTRSSTCGTLPVRRGSDHRLGRTRAQPADPGYGRRRPVTPGSGPRGQRRRRVPVRSSRPRLSPGARQDGPHREPEVAGQDAPAAGQVLDDGQPAAAYRGERGLRGPWPGHAAAIAHRHLERSFAQRPGNQHPGAGQRPGVDDRVGQQFAYHDGCVTDRRRNDARLAQVGADLPARGHDAGRSVRQQHDARRTHLPRAPLPAGSVPPGDAQRAHPGNRQPLSYRQSLWEPSAASPGGPGDPGSMGSLCCGDGHWPDDMAGRGDLMEQADSDRSAQSAPATAGTLDVQARAAGPRAGGPGGTGASWIRRIAAHKAARHVALLLVFIAAGVAVTWPLATHLPGGRLPSSRDTASYVWGFWWVAHQVTHLGNPWFTDLMAAPVGVQLGFHTLMPLPSLLLTPVTLIFGPSASYNLLVLITPGLLCYAMYRAARLWIASAMGAIAAGAFFGLSAMLTQQDWYHVNIALGA